MKVNSIIIVGGGSSGWMTAAALSKNFPSLKISLIESEKEPVGVGESTLGLFNDYLNYLGLKDEDWMSYCNATYKVSIAFKNFREGKGERFQYPFGPSIKGEDNHFYHFLKYKYPEDYPPEEGARFFNRQTLLAESGKFFKEKISGIDFDWDNNVSYHFDAHLFGKFLKEKIALPNNVSYYKEKIIGFDKDKEGNLKTLYSDLGNKFEADLFIDCTGFKSLLLENFMGVKFEPFKDFLFNDSALVTHIPYIDKENQLTTWTDCVAMDNGWVWEIPLWSRIGSGYVFSSKYISINDAEEEYRKYLSKTYSSKIGEEVKLKLIKIKHGKHEKAWYNNVVSIGLSYGFIEPLESTGLLTTHENILKLTNILESRKGIITQINIDEYNDNIDYLISKMMIFVAQHYFMSSRTDTPYWNDCVNNKNFSNNIHYKEILNEEMVSFFRRRLNSWWDFEKNNRGSLYIALGQGLSPYDLKNYENLLCEDGFKEFIKEFHYKWQKEKTQIISTLNQYPSHYQYLKNNIYNV